MNTQPSHSSQASHPSQQSRPPRVILPHSGYRKLIAYRKSEVIYQGTVVFCRRFLPTYGDCTVDQMTQTARFCKQNIGEGSAAAAVSLETQLKLTGWQGRRWTSCLRMSGTGLSRMGRRSGRWGTRARQMKNSA